jgi:hypothetical protein
MIKSLIGAVRGFAIRIFSDGLGALDFCGVGELVCAQNYNSVDVTCIHYVTTVSSQ